jgi:hypothetical protein
MPVTQEQLSKYLAQRSNTASTLTGTDSGWLHQFFTAGTYCQLVKRNVVLLHCSADNNYVCSSVSCVLATLELKAVTTVQIVNSLIKNFYIIP